MPGAPDWMEQLIEAAISAVVTVDAGGRVVRFNTSAEAMFGYDREEALGRQLGELVVPPDRQTDYWSTIVALATGESDELLGRRSLQRAMRKGGEEFPVEWLLIRTSDEPPQFSFIVRDLSSLEAAEERSSRMENLLATSEELAHLGSWKLDLHTGEGLWSDQMYRIHGFEPGTVQPTVDLVIGQTHPEDRERVRAVFQAVAAKPEQLMDGVTVEYRLVRPDGSVRELVARGRVEADAEGRPARWVGCAQDVTDRRLTERELHAHYALGQALRDWETFDEGVVDLLRRLGTALDYCAGSLWVMDPRQERLWCRAFWSVPELDFTELEAATRSRTYQLGEGFPGRAWVSERPAFSEDDGSESAAAGLRFGIAFPAVGDSGPLAVLSFHAPDRREATERLSRTLTGIGRELGRFLSQRRADLGAAPLSERELEVLRLAADGNSGPEIAERLILSPATVKTHFENIYEKLGVSDRAAAVAHGFRTGLIR